jgi:small-conductance mechanosensitive channel
MAGSAGAVLDLPSPGYQEDKKEMPFSPRPVWLRIVWLVLLLAGAGAAFGQTASPPQRPFAQLIDVWSRQLDRIATRAEQAILLPVEIDALREQVADVRAAASAAAAIARNDLADTRKLLAPLEVKPGAEAVPETDAVKADRTRLSDLAAVSESQLKQCEVIIARADQLTDRLTKLRGQVMLDALLHRNISPLSPDVWRDLGAQFKTAVETLSTALAVWGREGLSALGSGEQDLTALAVWAVVTVALWWLGRFLRRRFGRGHEIEPGQRDRTIAAAVDGVGLVLVPILAVLLLGKLLAATAPPAPLDVLVPDLIGRVIVFLLVIGLTATALSPRRPAWRVLPFSTESAHELSRSVRRLMAVGLAVEFVYLALTRNANDHTALASVGALVLAVVVALLTLPALSNRAWHAAPPEDAATGVDANATSPRMIGGTWWSIVRLLLSVLVLSAIIFALLGYAALAAHLHAAIFSTALLIAIVFMAHRLVGDLLEEAAAPDTPPGRWVRRRLGLPPDSTLRGQHLVMLLFDLFLVLLLAVGIPAVWSVDTDAIIDGAGQLMRGVKVGNVTISLGNVGMAILAFVVCIVMARLVRSIVRDRVLPTVDAPMPLRQSIDAGLNYIGVLLALVIGIGALGVDFTNLAIVLGALSVGIGLGLQNIANNVISGVILLVERPIKAGDWVSVAGHEGFIRRINIRATEMETFQRTHVIMPNSTFLQNPVVNRTYSDTSSRVEIKLTVGLATDVAMMEAVLREAALGHPRVLRVPPPIVRFERITPAGLEFELFVFVNRLEDRLVVTNDLNRTILARLIEAGILDPKPIPTFKLHGIEAAAGAVAASSKDGDAAASP